MIAAVRSALSLSITPGARRRPGTGTVSRIAWIFLLSLLGVLASSRAQAVSFHSTAIDVTPDGEEVWVVNPDHGSVSVIKATQPDVNTLIAEIPVGLAPWCLDIHPTNGEVWVASSLEDVIFVVDRSTRTVIDTLDAAFEAFGVAFNPSGTTALVTATGSDEVLVIDVATRSLTQSIGVYRRPRAIAWKNDGTRAWISHLLTIEYTGRLSVLDTSDWSVSEIPIQQVFGLQRGGYPSMMQNMTLAPAPADSLLWLPCNLLNSSKGELSGHPLTPTNTFHSVVRPINVNSNTDLNWDTYFLSEGGSPNSGYPGATPVGGSIAVDFRPLRAYVANFHSNNVTVLSSNLLNASEILVFPAGDAPIGIVTHPIKNRAYVANWLSRDVTIFNTSAETLVATVPSTTNEVLPAQILHGKKLFFTSTGRMSFENRNSCGACHVFGRPDGQVWDLTQFGGRHFRATKDWRGCGNTGPLGWTCAFDEIQDNEWSIRGLLGGAGLIDGAVNPSLGPPNRGLSRDLDDLSLFIATQTPREDTPFLNADGSLTVEADSGRALFNDPSVGCAICHPHPFYTDSFILANPWLRHDVGTADPEDADAAGGFDTPSLIAVWDSGPYLHNHFAKTLQAVLTTFNPNDEHGTTSHLSLEQIDFLVAFMNSIGWPDSICSPVNVPEEAFPARRKPGTEVFPNPFRSETSLRFAVENSPTAVRIDVFDVTGRRVRTLLDRTMPRGTHIVGWDGLDNTGRRVAAGNYFARVALDGRESGGQKMCVMR